MKKPSELIVSDTVVTLEGEGILVATKPGNFRNRMYKVQFASGDLKWYSLIELQKAYKLSANG
jgi:hypothetical protein